METRLMKHPFSQYTFLWSLSNQKRQGVALLVRKTLMEVQPPPEVSYTLNATSPADMIEARVIKVSSVPPLNRVLARISVDERCIDGEGAELVMMTQVEWPDLMLLNTYVPSTFVADATNPKQHDATQKRRQTAKDFRVAWDAEALKFVEAVTKTKPLVWIGDLNVTLEDADSAVSRTSFSAHEMECFGKMLGSGLVDAWRRMHPVNPKQSSMEPIYTCNESRLDYTLVSTSLASRIAAAAILGGVTS